MKSEYYSNRIDELAVAQNKINRQSNQFSFLRLTSLIIGFALSYLVFKFSILLGLCFIFLVATIFIVILNLHNRLLKIKVKNDNLMQIFENEIKLDISENIFGSGIKYIDHHHEFTSDLDIFGKYSLFNLINRTVTNEGELILADKLKYPDFKLAQKTQKIIIELTGKVEFKEKFLNCFFIADKSTDENQKISKWASVFKFYFSTRKTLLWFLGIDSIITFLSLFMGFAFHEFWNLSVFLLIFNYFIVMKFNRRVNLIHEHISKQSDIFKKYSALINIINSENFSNQDLRELQNRLKSEDNIEYQLNYLSKLINKLDYRLNVLMSAFLNLIFFWDIHYSYKIEKWMAVNSSKISSWLNTIGELDALLSLSILNFNHPEWHFPIFSDKDIFVKAKSLAHPLIKSKDRISNDYNLNGMGHFDIITGSNMAGKSTFLRTLGVNIILAQTGCPVCAESMELSDLKLITYMRISDSLEDNLSTFHAELERIKSILVFTEAKNNCFVLLDELLRGTNSEDRHIGTVALIRQLMKNKASGIIATHDLAMTKMEGNYPETIRNFNFNVKTKDDELFFDYKLTPGVCNYFNASLLMKKIGIKIDEIIV